MANNRAIDKKTIEIIITSLLALIFIIMAVRALKPRRPRIRAPKSVESKISAQQGLSIDEKYKFIQQEADGAPWRRNPFMRGSASLASGYVSLNLTGIIWDEKAPYAMLGDAVVREGDMIGNYTVIKINQNSVVVKGDEGVKVLNIWEGEDDTVEGGKK